MRSPVMIDASLEIESFVRVSNLVPNLGERVLEQFDDLFYTCNPEYQ